jgi:hypothetical protein
MGPFSFGRPTPAHSASFRASPCARSRHPLGVAHVCSCTAREPPQCPLAVCCFICAPTTPAFISARAAPEPPRCRTRLARIACSCSSLHCSCFQRLLPFALEPATLRCPHAWPLLLGLACAPRHRQPALPARLLRRGPRPLCAPARLLPHASAWAASPAARAPALRSPGRACGRRQPVRPPAAAC